MTNSRSPSLDLSLDQLPRILQRHKGKAVVFFCVVSVATLVAVASLPHEYVSECKLFVRVGRETVALDPTTTTGQTLNVHTNRKDEINSVVALLGSRVVMEKVADELGHHQILGARKSSLVTWPARKLGEVRGAVSRLFTTRDSGSASQNARSEAVAVLRKVIQVAAERDTTVINIRCRTHSPKMSKLIADSLVDKYRQEHMRLHRTSGSDEFFRDQTALLQKRFDEASSSLLALKNKSGIGTVTGELALLEAKKASIEQNQLTNERDIVASREKCRALGEAMAQLEETIMQTQVEGRPNAAADGMRLQLYEQQIKERHLLETYEPQHPRVKLVRRQVEALRNMLKDESGPRSEATLTLNPNRLQLQLQLLQERAQLAGLVVAKESLEEQHSEVLLALRELNLDSLRIAHLQREADFLDETYKNYARSFELARIDSALQHEQISNVNVVQDADLPEIPAGPRKTLLAGLGVLAGLFGGLALAVLADWWDRSLNSPADLERALEIPVLIAIPDSHRATVRT